MDTTGYCKSCGKIKRHFCCQTCYEKDATKSTKKHEMSSRIAELEVAIMAIHIDKEPYANVKSAILDAQKLVTK